jgi:hypothetical protein
VETEMGLEVRDVAGLNEELWVKTPRERMKAHGKVIRASVATPTEPAPAAPTPHVEAEEVEHQSLQDLIDEVVSRTNASKVA